MLKMNVSVKRYGKPIPLLMTEISEMFHFETQERIKEIAEEAAEDMKNTIKSSKVRPETTGNKLENSIEAVSLSTTGGVEMGVGDTEKAPKYWELLDRGGKHPMAGRWVPSGEFDVGNPAPDNSEFRKAGNWAVGQGKHSFKVSEDAVFPGIDYIGKAAKEAIYKLLIFIKVVKDQTERIAREAKLG